MDALVVFSVLLSILIHPSFQEAGKQPEQTFWSEIQIREVCGKSKWKFKMAFAIRLKQKNQDTVTVKLFITTILTN